MGGTAPPNTCSVASGFTCAPPAVRSPSLSRDRPLFVGPAPDECLAPGNRRSLLSAKLTTTLSPITGAMFSFASHRCAMGESNRGGSSFAEGSGRLGSGEAFSFASADALPHELLFPRFVLVATNVPCLWRGPSPPSPRSPVPSSSLDDSDSAIRDLCILDRFSDHRSECVLFFKDFAPSGSGFTLDSFESFATDSLATFVGVSFAFATTSLASSFTGISFNSALLRLCIATAGLVAFLAPFDTQAFLDCSGVAPGGFVGTGGGSGSGSSRGVSFMRTVVCPLRNWHGPSSSEDMAPRAAGSGL